MMIRYFVKLQLWLNYANTSGQCNDLIVLWHFRWPHRRPTLTLSESSGFMSMNNINEEYNGQCFYQVFIMTRHWFEPVDKCLEMNLTYHITSYVESFLFYFIFFWCRDKFQTISRIESWKSDLRTIEQMIRERKKNDFFFMILIFLTCCHHIIFITWTVVIVSPWASEPVMDPCRYKLIINCYCFHFHYYTNLNPFLFLLHLNYFFLCFCFSDVFFK